MLVNEQVAFCKHDGIRVWFHHPQRSVLTRQFHPPNVLWRNPIQCQHGLYATATYHLLTYLNRYLRLDQRLLAPSVYAVYDKLYFHTADDEYLKWAWQRHHNEVKTYHPNLRGYQNCGVALIRNHPAYALFWEQRTGKTPTVAVAIKNTNKVIIAVPYGHELNWKEHMETWAKRHDVVVLPRSPAKRRFAYQQFNKAENQVLIGSYTTLAKDVRGRHSLHNDIKWEPLPYGVLVVDECHFLRNNSSLRSIGMKYLRLVAKRLVLLTGTPVAHKPQEVIPLLQFLHPDGAYLKYEICDTMFASVWSPFVKWRVYENVKPEHEEAFSEMLSQVSHRLLLKDVWEQMPKVIHTHYDIAMQPMQDQHYRRMLLDFQRETPNGSKLIDEANVLTQMIRLRQIALDPAVCALRGQGSKTEWLVAYRQRHPEQNVVVWSTSTHYLKHLHEKVMPWATLFTGQQSALQRQRGTANFQKTPGSWLLVNVTAGHQGWTWDKADVMIFVDRDWNPAKNEQAERRMFPVDPNEMPHKAKLVIDLTSQNTIDHYVRKALDEKWDRTQIVSNYPEFLAQYEYKGTNA